MRCDSMRDLLSEYIDGRLAPEAARSVEAHVSSCRVCADELGVLRQAKAVLASKQRVLVPADLEVSFLKRLERISGRRPISVFFSSRHAREFAMAMAAALVFVAVWNFISPPAPIVSNPTGTVKIYIAKRNEWAMVERPVRVGRNDIVKTFQASQADIEMPGVGSMRLKANTEMRIDSLGSRIARANITYSIEKGKALIFHRQRKVIANVFRIQTPQALNTALGTDFMVNVIPEAQKTWVGVLDGAVKVQNLDDPLTAVVVNAGQKTEIFQNMAPKHPEALLDEEWNEIQELYQIGRKPQVALLISTGENRVRELLRPCPLYISDKKDSPIPALVRETAAIFNAAIKEKSAEKHLAAIAKFEDIVASFPDKRYNVQFLLFIGAYYHYLGQYEEAIDTFERVVAGYPDASGASLAQCAIGIIYEEDLHDPDKAAAAYQAVLSRYPKSPEAPEATDGLKRLSR